MENRRDFLKKTGSFLAASALSPRVFSIPTRKRKLGVALVGLGYYSTEILAPALQKTQYCELKGIVTGSQEKIRPWQEKYNIPDRNVYSYQNMVRMANNPEIDVVYIVLPNALHLPYAALGAECGKHVWCEKPMATTVRECEQMIAACQKNKVQLTVGYRMQHEPVTRKVIGWRDTRPFGKIKGIYSEAGFYYNGKDKNHWKLKKELGGGAMFDMGVYSLNAARYVTGLEPISVIAEHRIVRTHMFEADETTYFEMEFPEGIKASCRTTFASNISYLRVPCERGWYQLSPFQTYSGVGGYTSYGEQLLPSQGNQQVRQMDNDALAIFSNTPEDVVVPGIEGLRDIRVVEGIFKSAANNSKRITL